MSLHNQHSFWGSLSPLGGLTGAGLLVMASARLSWAVTIAGCLFWVYGLTTLTFTVLLSAIGNKFFPVSGRITLYTCLAALFGSLYLLMFWLLSPFAALETFVLILLVPLFCASSGIIEQIQAHSAKSDSDARVVQRHDNSSIDVFEHVSDAVSQAVSLAGLIVAFSIIREPLAYCSLSFPGSAQGMMTIMYFKAGSFFPIGIFTSSAGALMLLGFIICMYQYNKTKIFSGRM